MNEAKKHNLISAIFGAAYGIFGALGFFCLANWFPMAIFGERHRYPDLYPFCIIAGTVSLVLCIGLLCGNICYICNRSRIKNEAEKSALKLGIVVEAVAAFFVFNICFVILAVVYELVRSSA